MARAARLSLTLAIVVASCGAYDRDELARLRGRDAPSDIAVDDAPTPGDVTQGVDSAVDATAPTDTSSDIDAIAVEDVPRPDVTPLDAGNDVRADVPVFVDVPHDAGPPVTVSFQNGVSPSVAYNGCTDTYLAQKAPMTNNGAGVLLLADGDDPGDSGMDLDALVRWNIATIPLGSVVRAVTITLVVRNPTVAVYSLHQMLRGWSAAQATWLQATSTTAWTAPGGRATSERSPTVLGTVGPAMINTVVTLTLNTAGLAAVQGWVDNPARNFGIAIAEPAAPDGVDLASCDAVVPSERPRLTITYAPP